MVQNIGNRLIQTISHQAEKAGYFCIAENISSNQKVHELRRGFKRLRALLRFFKEIPDSPAIQLNEDIRNFGKLLAPLRESAVNVELFEKEISLNKLLPERKIRNARELLVQQNKLLVERGFLENNLNNTIRTFFDGFESILTKKGSEFPSRVQLFREVSKSYLKSNSVYHQLPASPHPEELHELRKKLKRLWYQFDFIRFLHPRYFKMKTDQLNKITDQLGDDHDLHVFIEDAVAERRDFNDEEMLILTNQVEHLRQLNQQKLQLRLKQFFAAPPSEFDQKLERFFKL
ncbi:CHAD domain-containing protein [Mariniphaga anaerophila]|uniref:CHAD domain-containing protein n=1 Tax=Mariniphaga anaerophila TaxID=1484053 RepID=A0A1M5BC37_9BACT|nr:CHAD domain-containing protein [Mariniphaga anaerophila]SHF40141.1 CHAD domain-containing protein [Mariniphaga anaerophila]